MVKTNKLFLKQLSLLSIFIFSSQFIQAQDCLDDNLAPVFSSLPQDLVISCGEDAPEQVTLTATDNCNEIVDFKFNQNGAVESSDLLFMMSRIGGGCN